MTECGRLTGELRSAAGGGSGPTALGPNAARNAYRILNGRHDAPTSIAPRFDGCSRRLRTVRPRDCYLRSFSKSVDTACRPLRLERETMLKLELFATGHSSPAPIF